VQRRCNAPVVDFPWVQRTDRGETVIAVQTRGSRRGLSTARAALQVAWLLAARPEGIRADHVAETLGKSVSTAYNLLASLCEEGVAIHEPGGVYRLSPAFRDTVTTGAIVPAPELHDLAGLVADLLARTHKRSYLAVVRSGELHVVLERGLQGMPKLPGLKTRVGDSAHAVALGKVVLALAAPEVLERYVRRPGLRRFTAHTITDPDALRAELAEARRRGYAVEREEFDDDFCCVAAPVRDARGRFLAVIGISMSRRAFDEEHERLAATVRDVAGVAAAAGPRRPRAAGGGAPPNVAPLRASGGPNMAPVRASAPAGTRAFQASAETRSVLDPPGSARLVSTHGTSRAVSAACARTSPSASALARSERR
jgi:DNA-binding IclR family transcriptional regulator